MHCAISKGAGKELTIDGDVAIPRMYSIMVNVLVFVKLTADVFILGTEVAHAMQQSDGKQPCTDACVVSDPQHPVHLLPCVLLLPSL